MKKIIAFFAAHKSDVLLYAFFFSVFLLVNPGKPTIDDYLRLVEAVTIVNDQRFDIAPEYLSETGYIFYPGKDGKLYTHWGLLSSLIYTPAEIIGRLLQAIYPQIREIELQQGRPLLFQRFIVTMLILPVIMLINVHLTKCILRRVFAIDSGHLTFLLLSLCFIGTQLLRYSSGFEEGFAILLCLLSILVYESSASSTSRGMGIGIIAGLTLNARYTALPVFALFVLFEIYRREKWSNFILSSLVGFIPYAFFSILYNYIRYESFSPTAFFLFHANLGWNDYDYLVRQSLGEIIQFVVHQSVGSKGLFVFNPMLCLAPYGFWLGIKQRGLNSPTGRLMVLSSFVVIYYLVFHAVFIQGGLDPASWGPRFLTTAVPFLFLMSVPALKFIGQRWSGTIFSSPVKVIMIAVVVLGFFIQVLSVLGWEETETYQGHSTNQITQRASNLWSITIDGNPFNPRSNVERPLFKNSLITEPTNKDGQLITHEFRVKELYEGFSLWPVTLGYSLRLGTGIVCIVIMVSFLACISLGVLAYRSYQY